jgi:hypothetical protein
MYRPTIPGLFALLTLLFVGCESTLKERFAEAPPKTHEFNAPVERVYAAAQAAFKRHDFKIVWKTMGRIQAASAINRSQAMGDSRQLIVEFRFRESSPGVTESQMWLTQDVTGDGTGASYRKPLPESDFYELYFAALQQFLDADDRAVSTEKK